MLTRNKLLQDFQVETKSIRKKSADADSIESVLHISATYMHKLFDQQDKMQQRIKELEIQLSDKKYD